MRTVYFLLLSILFGSAPGVFGCDGNDPEDTPACVESNECATDEVCSADGMCVPDLTPPGDPTPTNLSATLTGQFGIQLSWDVVRAGESEGDPAVYRVYRAPAGSDSFELLADEIADTGYEDASSEAAYRRHEYRVTGMIDGVESAPTNTVASDPFAPENELLDSTFTIDVIDIDVSLDIYVTSRYVEGRAAVQFRMRDQQSYPRLHFRMLTGDGRPGDELLSVSLDGEELSRNDDIEVVNPGEGVQELVEFQRPILDDDVHVLEFHYLLFIPTINNDPFVFTRVTDLHGYGNGQHFPCLNTPGELAMHHMTLRLHEAAEGEYELFGTGDQELPAPNQDGVLEWNMDTPVEIPSSGVMFGAVPTTPAFYTINRRQSVINGIEVDVLGVVNPSFPSDPDPIDTTFSTLATLLPELEADLGPLPTDRLTIFVPDDFSSWPGSGSMEFHGGTLSRLNDLEHEIFHMYFAYAVVFKTYRDSWLDEAIDNWYTRGTSTAIEDRFSSDIVGFVDPTGNAFDDAAYRDGPGIIQRFALAAGGRTQMIEFLRYLVDNYAYQPMSTIDFIRYFNDFTGVDLYPEMIQWVYENERDY